MFIYGKDNNNRLTDQKLFLDFMGDDAWLFLVDAVICLIPLYNVGCAKFFNTHFIFLFMHTQMCI